MVPDMDTVFCLKRETGKPEENPLMHRQLRGDFFVCHVIGAQKCDLLFPSRRLMKKEIIECFITRIQDFRRYSGWIENDSQIL